MKYRIIVRDRVREDIRRNRDWWAEHHSEAQAERTSKTRLPLSRSRAYSVTMAGGMRSIEGNNDRVLFESIDALRDQVEVLRNAVDDLRIEVQYLVRNPGETRVTATNERLRVTSPPLDPAADDFGQRVNTVPELE